MRCRESVSECDMKASPSSQRQVKQRKFISLQMYCSPSQRTITAPPTATPTTVDHFSMDFLSPTNENNLGVAYLETADFGRALECFRSALIKFTDPELSSALAEYDSSSHKERLCVQTPDSSTIFAYTNGIILMSHALAYSPDEVANKNVVASIILFNLALVNHLKGLGSPSQRRLLLDKAARLYEQSHGLLLEVGVARIATGNCVVDVLCMALFNNMAHVAFELSAYPASRLLFDSLISFALSVVPSRYNEAMVSDFVNLTKSQFLLNEAILVPPRLASAA
jgi:tetratricopeptide (TPR) repeat protein